MLNRIPKFVGKVGTLYRNTYIKPRISIANHATIIFGKEEKRFCLKRILKRAIILIRIFAQDPSPFPLKPLNLNQTAKNSLRLTGKSISNY